MESTSPQGIPQVVILKKKPNMAKVKAIGLVRLKVVGHEATESGINVTFEVTKCYRDRTLEGKRATMPFDCPTDETRAERLAQLTKGYVYLSPTKIEQAN